MPHVVKRIQDNSIEEALNTWKESIRLASLIMCFFCVSFFVFAPQVISVLYSDKYLPGLSVFRIYLLTELFRLTYYGMVLNAKKRTQLILYSSIGSMIVNLVLDIVLFKLIGINGPAWATVASVAAMNMFQLVSTKKLLNVSFLELYPVSFIFKSMILNLFLAIPFVIIQNLIFKFFAFNHNLITIVIGGIWLLLYFLKKKKKVMMLWKSLNE